ncbi:trna rrna methyltransferase [Nannochloropsis gaditana CCMP526]|nr:trna rrna methyltransferase [Nannochloropsis gaditana CCMP526]EKU23059.1 trna rrna methyltransferase [Nannochloropsis gaditana CCMP526]|eukprot:XP_005852777.1 trna rrna methyltransferase [Nannochloropsis gaditana CCMP526]
MSRLQSFPRSMHPLVLILDNVRSAYNVGSLFRTAETALLQELITCGFTPHPPHEKLKKTACRSLENVPSRHFSTTLDAVRTMKEEGFVVFAMETTSRSQCYTHVAFPEKAALVLGNEVIGVDTAVLEECDGGIIEIPTFGQKNSLNVASAAPVVVFEVLRQWGTFDKAEGKVDKT